MILEILAGGGLMFVGVMLGSAISEIKDEKKSEVRTTRPGESAGLNSKTDIDD